MPTPIITKNGETLAFRKLTKSDGNAFGRFLEGLTTETRSKFGPHPLNSETAHQLCAAQPERETVRFVLTAKDKITGYFILDFRFAEHETSRYQQAGITLDSRLDPLFAPCICDSYQNQGVASQAMAEVIRYCRERGFRRLVLMGGTQAPNHLAINFYKKVGFTEVGQFYTGYNNLNNLDMMLML